MMTEGEENLEWLKNALAKHFDAPKASTNDRYFFLKLPLCQCFKNI
jgi:hypothetical protein